MDLPASPPVLTAMTSMAGLIRDRLAGMGESVRDGLIDGIADGLAPLLTRRDQPANISTLAAVDRSVIATARQVATVIIGATTPFAPTSFSRARLMRQLHASGLLSADEMRRASVVLDLQSSTALGAPH